MGSTESVLLYLHIPKAAGTTMSSLLYEQMRSSEDCLSDDGLFCSGVFYHPAGYVKEMDAALEPSIRNALKREDLTAVLGHFSFGLHEKLSRPSHYVTVLREPVSRVLSLYHFQRLNEQKYGHLDQIRLPDDADITHFVTDPPYAEIDNGMTRRISGESPAIGKCDSRMLDRAIRHLRNDFAVVGLSDHFDETIVLMAQLLNWPEPPLYYPRNVNTHRPTDDSSDTEAAALIRERSALDVELYRVASEIFHRQISELGREFPMLLNRYRERKQAWYDEHGIG